MKHAIQVLTGNRKLFFQGLLYLLFTATIALLFFGNTFGNFSIHTYHPFWLNVFFINYTFIGNGLFAVCLAAIFIFYYRRKNEGLALLCGFVLSSIIVQLLRNIGNFSHPKLLLEQGQYLFSQENVSIAVQGSFISGHTATAFALATVLMLTAKRSYWQLPLLFAAVLVAYSRIYLAQHLVMDVLIAAVVGTVSGVAAVYFAYQFKGSRYHFKKFYNNTRRRTITMGENIQTV